MNAGLYRGFTNRILQLFARIMPGAMTLRVYLHRLRGVRIGTNVWIGYDSIIETSHPEWVTIHDNAGIGIRVTIIAHYRETRGVVIGEGAIIGPGSIILPGVKIGSGAVIAAGSVVSRSVPAMTVVQGNPATPIAECGIAYGKSINVRDFSRALKPIKRSKKP